MVLIVLFTVVAAGQLVFLIKFLITSGEICECRPACPQCHSPWGSNSSATDVPRIRSTLMSPTTHSHTLPSSRQSLACLSNTASEKKNDTWPSSCTPLWFMILLCLEENQRHVKEGNLGSLLCTTWDAVAWGPLGEASSCLSSPSPPVGVFPLSPRCSAQRCRAQWQACPKNSPRGWRGKSANRGGVACTAFSSKKVTPN